MVTGKKIDDPLYRPDINNYVDAIEMDALSAWSKVKADGGKRNARPEKQLFVGQMESGVLMLGYRAAL